jgi:hypothetical protein
MAAYLRSTSAIFSALVLAACAATPGNVKPPTATAAAVTHDPNCPTQTGSPIAVNGKECSGIGRAYTREDIDRTGATTTEDAMRLLDPSVTIHH